MWRERKLREWILGGVMLPLLLVAFLAGCGSANDRTDNANEFREKVTQLGHDVRLIPEREGRPDLVEGIVISKDGLAKQFSFAFGPAPNRDLPDPAVPRESVWFTKGDQVYFWVDYEFGSNKQQRENFYDAAFAVEDTACQVVADQDCGF